MFCCRSVNAHGYIHSTTQKVITMKRTFKSLLAAAGLAFIGLGSLLTATPAMAYTPKAPCVKYPSTPTASWPGNGHFFICTGIANDPLALISYTQANSVPANLKTKFNAQGTDVFVFQNVSNYNAYPDFEADVPASGAPVKGYSRSTQGAKHPGAVVAIFSIPSGNNFMARVTNHELGHGMDFATGNEGTTNGSVWSNRLAQDFADFDAPATGKPNFPGFTFVCNLFSTNTQRLLCMQQNNNPFKRDEMFAEEFATLMPKGAIFGEAGAVIGNYFRQLGALTPSRPRSRDRIVDLINQP